MNTESTNIALARFMGWEEAFPKNKEAHPETKRAGILLPYIWVNTVTHQRRMDLPNYCTDLNAIALVEARLTEEQWHRYVDKLIELLDLEYLELDYHGIQYRVQKLLSATAEQHAQALVAALGLTGDGV